MPDRVRWTYENSDAEVEGSVEKYREMCQRGSDLARGMPVLLEGEAGEPEADPGETSQADDGEPATYTCAGETASGNPCSREVDTDGDYCYQHGPD